MNSHTMISYFVSSNINDNFHLNLGLHKFHHNNEDLLKLVMQFDVKIKTSFMLQEFFLTLFELTCKENLKFTGKPGRFFLNSVYKQ